MKLNAHGFFGILSMFAVAAIAIHQGGHSIAVGTVLIMTYGVLILSAKAASEWPPNRYRSQRNPSGNLEEILEPPQPYEIRYRVAANTWLYALHVTVLATAATLALALGQPVGALLALPVLAAFVFGLFGHAVTPHEDGPILHAASLLAILPPAVLLATALLSTWEPGWYAVLAIILYCLMLLLRLAAYKRPKNAPSLPWPFLTRPEKYSEPIKPYCVLILISLGQLVDVSTFSEPADIGYLSGHDLYQACIFIGCYIGGLAIPALLLSDKPS